MAAGEDGGPAGRLRLPGELSIFQARRALFLAFFSGTRRVPILFCVFLAVLFFCAAKCFSQVFCWGAISLFLFFCAALCFLPCRVVFVRGASSFLPCRLLRVYFQYFSRFARKFWARFGFFCVFSRTRRVHLLFCVFSGALLFFFAAKCFFFDGVNFTWLFLFCSLRFAFFTVLSFLPCHLELFDPIFPLLSGFALWRRVFCRFVLSLRLFFSSVFCSLRFEFFALSLFWGVKGAHLGSCILHGLFVSFGCLGFCFARFCAGAQLGPICCFVSAASAFLLRIGSVFPISPTPLGFCVLRLRFFAMRLSSLFLLYSASTIV